MSIASLQAARAEPDAHAPAFTAGLVRVARADGGGDVEIIPSRPAVLAKRLGLPLERLSLAMMLGGEGYGSKDQDPHARELGQAAAMVAKCQVVMDTARRRGVSVTDLLTASKVPEANGFYGRQGDGPRFAATSQVPSNWKLEVARQCLDGEVPDLIQGNGTHFIALAVWGDKLKHGMAPTQAGKTLGPYENILRRWILDEKNVIVDVPTVDPYHELHLRKAGLFDSPSSSYKRALDIMDRGMRGESLPAPGDPDAVGSPLPPVVGACAALVLFGLGFYALVTA